MVRFHRGAVERLARGCWLRFARYSLVRFDEFMQGGIGFVGQAGSQVNTSNHAKSPSMTEGLSVVKRHRDPSTHGGSGWASYRCSADV